MHAFPGCSYCNEGGFFCFATLQSTHANCPEFMSFQGISQAVTFTVRSLPTYHSSLMGCDVVPCLTPQLGWDMAKLAILTSFISNISQFSDISPICCPLLALAGKISRVSLLVWIVCEHCTSWPGLSVRLQHHKYRIHELNSTAETACEGPSVNPWLRSPPPAQLKPSWAAQWQRQKTKMVVRNWRNKQSMRNVNSSS